MKMVCIFLAALSYVVSFMGSFTGDGNNFLSWGGFVGMFLFALIFAILTGRNPKMIKCTRCGREQLKLSAVIRRDYCGRREWQCPICNMVNTISSWHLRGISGFKPTT